ncbi:MAG TPA: OpcA/G6PD domain-containing protein [Vicinamibacterales bacterium]|nr:OpcA/G6PD domain-containing protein [Vicinamibacterales bacterium]
MSEGRQTLLPDGVDVPFSSIAAALASGGDGTHRRADGRALMATVVAVGPHERLCDAAEALRHLGDGGVRAVLIPTGSQPMPGARVASNAIALRGLEPRFVDNAVAALRLSSLPTLVWWRGGPPETLDAVAALADRLLIDEDDPRGIWARALPLLDGTPIGDLHWTRLTRWRSLVANFFDMPEIRAAAAGFTQLRITAADSIAAALLAGWLKTSVEAGEKIEVSLADGTLGLPIEEITFGDGEQALELRATPSCTCVHTSATIRGHRSMSQYVPLGDQSLAALIQEELRIRSRDAAFERALHALVAGS